MDFIKTSGIRMSVFLPEYTMHNRIIKSKFFRYKLTLDPLINSGI